MNCFKRPLAALVLKLLKLTNSFENFFRNLILQIMKAAYELTEASTSELWLFGAFN